MPRAQGCRSSRPARAWSPHFTAVDSIRVLSLPAAARSSHSTLVFFFLVFRPPPRSTLFPYTTLFRSDHQLGVECHTDFLRPHLSTEHCLITTAHSPSPSAPAATSSASPRPRVPCSR